MALLSASTPAMKLAAFGGSGGYEGSGRPPPTLLPPPLVPVPLPPSPHSLSRVILGGWAITGAVPGG